MFRNAPAFPLRMAALLITLTAPIFAHAAEGKAMGLVTGAKSGTYYLIGKDIADVAKKEGINIQVRESGGSVDNLQKMATTGENAALGIVQSDVISFLMRSTMPKSKMIAEKLRVVMPLFKEEVHLLARKEIASFDQLAGKRVVVGSAGSGSMMTAVNLLSQLGVKPKRMFEVSPAEAIVAVLANRADAMIFVGGKPVPMFENLGKLSGNQDGNMSKLLQEVHFLALPASGAKGVYETARLSGADYPYITQDVPTLAVRSVLVGFDFTRKNTAYYKARCAQLHELGRALSRALPELKNGSGHAKWSEVDMNQDVKLWKRDACAWPAMQPTPAAETVKALPKEPETTIPQHSPFEKELLGIIGGK